MWAGLLTSHRDYSCLFVRNKFRDSLVEVKGRKVQKEGKKRVSLKTRIQFLLKSVIKKGGRGGELESIKFCNSLKVGEGLLFM